MTYTANQLISGAYYAAGIVSREFETVSGQQVTDGLTWLNNIISEKVVDDGMIPYESTYTFTAVTGQPSYVIPNLIAIDTLTFTLNTVRYSMAYTPRNQYFGSNRVNNINSLPFEWYFERSFGGGTLYIYFNPDREYPIEIHGMFRMTSVALGQNLSSNVTTANLGVPTLLGTGVLAPGQLIVNEIDLAGTYNTVGALVNYINTGVIPNVTASTVVNDFVLSSVSVPPIIITVTTSGLTPVTSTKGSTAAASTVNLNAVYLNGTLGVGATLTNAGAFAALSLDGLALNVGDLVLIKNQTSAIQNGIYIVTLVGDAISVNWVLTRYTNYNFSDKIQPGNLVLVTGGTTQANTSWEQTQEVATVGVDAISFISFSSISFASFNTQSVSRTNNYSPQGLDEFYTTYLRYALADRICAEYNYITPPNVLRQLGKYEAFINKKSKLLDLKLNKSSTLQGRTGLNWAFVNLSGGWSVPY